jgi:hypothetical protein
MSNVETMLNLVVHKMMEENKDEIDKAWQYFLETGKFCTFQDENGRVVAIHPSDMTTTDNPSTTAPRTRSDK